MRGVVLSAGPVRRAVLLRAAPARPTSTDTGTRRRSGSDPYSQSTPPPYGQSTPPPYGQPTPPSVRAAAAGRTGYSDPPAGYGGSRSTAVSRATADPTAQQGYPTAAGLPAAAVRPARATRSSRLRRRRPGAGRARATRRPGGSSPTSRSRSSVRRPADRLPDLQGPQPVPQAAHHRGAELLDPVQHRPVVSWITVSFITFGDHPGRWSSSPALIFCIMATVAASKHEFYKYPMNMRIIK